MLFTDWCNAYFLIKQNKVKVSTWQNKYFYNYRRYILPMFGERQIEEIKPYELEVFFYSDEVRSKSSAVKQKLYSLLYGIFQKAYDNDIISKNPMVAVELPEYKAVKEKRVYSQAQSDLLYSFCKQHRYGASIALMLKAGLRRGEVLGLRHCDVLRKEKLITVFQAVMEQGGRGVITTPKTGSSVRTLPVSSDLIDFCLSRASSGSGDNLLYPNSEGSAVSPHNWHNRQYKVFMDEFTESYPEISALRPHELRHTCGTLLYQSGVDIRTIQKFMGHASIEVTSAIYIHDDVEHMRSALGVDF